MDATSTFQGSLQDFIAPSKKARIAMLVIFLLFASMVIGLVYEGQQPLPEPVRYSTEISPDTYTYLDVQLLSEWLYKVTGDENHTYYEAMDSDENWFVVDLPDSTYNELEPFVDAYNYIFYEDMPYAEMPEAVRIYGMTRSLNYETTYNLASFYDVANTDYTDYFGSCYLDEGTTPENSMQAILIAGSIVFGIVLFIMLIQAASTNASYKKSDERLYTLGLKDNAEFEFTNITNQRFEKAKLVLSEHFLYSGSSRSVIPYADILWMYQRVQRHNGIAVGRYLVAGLYNGKSINVVSRGLNDELMNTVLNTVKAHNPDMLIGYSLDYARQYRAHVKEYKLNNR